MRLYEKLMKTEKELFPSHFFSSSMPNLQTHDSGLRPYRADSFNETFCTDKFNASWALVG
jgi:hypothetical protein